MFDNRPHKTTNLDRITDFKVADDTTRLKKSMFTKMTAAGFFVV